LWARVASADAPHGHYSLDALDRFPGGVTWIDHPLPSCGTRSKELLDRPSFEVSYSTAQLPGRHPYDDIVVDKVAWYRQLITADKVSAKSPRTDDGVDALISFRRDQGKAVGEIVVFVWENGAPVCGDARRLGGTFARFQHPVPAPPP
jgi:hypothetical protein